MVGAGTPIRACSRRRGSSRGGSDRVGGKQEHGGCRARETPSVRRRPHRPNLAATQGQRQQRRSTSDVLIVYFHWGTELATSPDSRQRRLADLAFRAGATIVLGAHPHVLQPIQRGGSKLVAWSLGNFVFPANSPGTTSTGILVAHLGVQGVVGARLVPATINGVRPVLDAPMLSR